MRESRHDKREALLNQLASQVIQAASAGALTGHASQPITIQKADTIAGPRAGAVEFYAGIQAGALYQALNKSQAALARQFVPWQFQGKVLVYWSGRAVRIEAAWPEELAETDIPLSSLGQYPRRGGRWIAGKNELGMTITLGLDDRTPHFLFSGTTGSGKTYAIRTAVYQLAQDPLNRIVLIDGKAGEGLGPLAGLPNLAGPIATNINLGEARDALAWAVAQMEERYRRLVTMNRQGMSRNEVAEALGRLIVVVDEVQEFTGKSGDSEMVELVRRLVSQGRGAYVHVLLATQQPTAEVFSDRTIKANLVGRVALKTTHAEASRAALGQSEPRADWLLGQGDAYCLVPGAVERAQLAYVPAAALRGLNGTQPDLSAWPSEEMIAGAEGKVGTGTAVVGDGRVTSIRSTRTRTIPTTRGLAATAHIAYGLVAAHLGHGRVAYQRALAEDGIQTPGNSQAVRILNFCRDVLTILDGIGWQICTPEIDL